MPGFWGEGRGVDKAEDEEEGELRKVSKAAIKGGSFKDRTQLEM